jgi:hypothetical protein
MLDLSVVLQKLTQGQPAAEMALALPPAAAPAPAAASTMAWSSAAQPAGAGTPAPVDAEALAARVYALMQLDLIVDNIRRGR